MGVQTVPEEDGTLYDRVVRGVEKELLQQVMTISDEVIVKAAKRLGINRNTLQKKLTSKEAHEGAEAIAPPEPPPAE